jgi:hypothetical protein
MSDQEKQNTPNKKVEDLVVPNEFNKIINDFISDIITTFPEYTGIIGRWWSDSSSSNEERKKNEIMFVFRHCIKTIPERFFDILYKNNDMFLEKSDCNTEFLPGIVFKQLWKCDISENTRETIWKYLQLILFSVIGSVRDSTDLGDTAKLFEAINEDELKSKLSETLENMSGLFDSMNGNSDEGNAESESNGSAGADGDAGIGMDKMPNVEELHSHINNLMGGKLGKLAMELAEETASELDLNMEQTANPKDVFQNLFKNPGKLMSMVQNIGGKIETKIKSGEIKESELMSEGMEFLNKMKSMPGMNDMSKLFSQMGIPGVGKNTKVNMAAMESQMNKNMKAAKMRERMRAKVEQKQSPQTTASSATATASATATSSATSLKPAMTEEELIKIFSTGEKAEKTPRGAKPPPAKKKKGKK